MNIKNIIILPILPISLFLCSWWLSISLFPEIWIKYFALGGLILGILIDIFLYRKHLKKTLPIPILILSYLFYSVCVFGFFMGVPAFNIFVCIPFVIYISQYYPKIFKKFNIFSNLTVLLICIASAYIALTDRYTIANLEGMFNMHGMLNNTILYIGVGVGGVMLVLINHLLWKYTYAIYKTLKHEA